MIKEKFYTEEEVAERMEDVKETLALYRQTISDVKYILGQYKANYPREAWDCIAKLINSPKLK
jgi:hypothetical protein